MGLTTAAHAQTTEAGKIATQAAEGYLNNGVLGLTCLVFIGISIALAFVIRHLYRDIKAGHAAEADRLERLIKTTEKTNSTLDAIDDTLKEFKSTLETRGAAIVDLSRQFEVIAAELRHGNNNLAQALEGVARWTRDLPEQVAGRMSTMIAHLPKDRGGAP